MRTLLSLLFLFILLCIISNAGAGKDFYKILGVPKSASADQIKRAYRKLAMKLHPDRNKEDKNAQEKFVEVSKAYEILSNPKKKEQYDAFGEEGLNEQQGQQFNAGNIFEQFFGGGGGSGFHFSFGGGNDFFGGGGEAQDPEDEFKGEDITLPLRVSLEELYSGKTIQFKRIRSAHNDGAMPKECYCNNKVIRMTVVNGVMKRVVENRCDECRNRFDVVQKDSELNVEIEPGMSDNEHITFYGEGDATAETRSGDLIFVVQAQPHSVFQRDGVDLKMKMTITLKEALVGFKREIKHLDGRSVEVSSTKVVKPGTVKRLRNKGMPLRKNPREFGDLYIQLDVEFPTDLTQAQQAELNKIL